MTDSPDPYRPKTNDYQQIFSEYDNTDDIFSQYIGGSNMNTVQPSHYASYNSKNNNNSGISPIRYKWQWQAGSKWKDYKVIDSQKMESQYGSADIVHIEIHNALYQIHLVHLQQINTSTGCKRRIRRVPVGHTDNTYRGSRRHKTNHHYFNQVATGHDNAGHINKDKNDKHESKYNNNSNATITYQTPSECEIVWQWLNASGTRWRDYDVVTSQFIESKFIENKVKIFECKIQKNDQSSRYFINLGDMTQSNAYTAKKRSIRRILAANKKNENNDGNYSNLSSPVSSAQIQDEQKGKKGDTIISEITQIVDACDLNMNGTECNGKMDPMSVVAQNFANAPHLKLKCVNQMNDIKEILKDKDKRQQIISKAKWHDSNKIPIFNKTATKKKLTLSLSKQEFIKRLNEFGDNNDGNIKLVPVLMDGDNNKVVKYLWIVTIDKCRDINIDIGISLQLTKTIKKMKTVVPVGIYLDINDERKLVNVCNANLILDEMKIGNVNVLENKIKDLRKKNEDYRNQLLNLQQYKWQWNNGDKYIDFDAKISKEMEILYQNKGQIYKYKNQEDGQMYTVNFNELKQCNDNISHNSTDIRRIPIDRVRWQWRNGKNFVDYNQKYSIEIEKAYKHKNKEYKFENNENKEQYTIQFSTMKQINNRSNNQRDVRRIPMAVKHERKQRRDSWPDPKTWKGPKQTAKRKVFGSKIMTLYHVTDPKSAELIFKEHKMIRGGKGMFGGGIYFTETVKNAKYISEHHGVLITAKVFVGKEHVVKDGTAGHFTFQQLQQMGYDSIYAPYGSGKGAPQRVVYNFDQVCVIKKEPCK